MNTLAAFANVHSNEKVIVCGCGQSLNELEHPERFVTIGVNDVGRKFQPDYLVVVNPPRQFAGDRFRYVQSSQARFIFTQLDLGLVRDNIVRFALGTQGGTDFSNRDVLHYTQNSPYVALCLAIHTGAKKIGLIGVDFTNDHFFGATGAHSLTAQLPVIDEQYRRLSAAARARGVEIYNLSATSKLTAFPKTTLAEFAGASLECGASAPLWPKRQQAAALQGDVQSPRVFLVNYNFVTCGDVFGTGLRNAAKQLGLDHELALWDDPNLHAKVERFRPDLIFVVHGRRFAEKWRGRFTSYKTAVWLVDEPYEVDDTTRWSKDFDTVFINDPNTITRHPNAHYLPVCFDPITHRDPGGQRSRAVGFVGGFNETRNQYLNEMAKAGLLSYVVGGPWKSPAVQQLSVAPRVSPDKTTALYQDTCVVLNVFRDVHHFNGARVPARSMNPRIYEALACGALVVSEEREEIREVFPELPTFSDSRSLVTTVGELLANESATRSLLEKNRARLEGHTYADRLAKVLQVCLGWQQNKEETRVSVAAANIAGVDHRPLEGNQILSDWIHVGDTATIDADGLVQLSKPHHDAPGSETGLASQRAFAGVMLSFDVWVGAETSFIAKVHQSDQLNQKTNSYHFVVNSKTAYTARHNHVFKSIPFTRGAWQAVVLRRMQDSFELRINGDTVVSVLDRHIKRGYCFLGVKGGRAKLRNVSLVDLSADSVVTMARSVKSNGNGASKPGAMLLPFTAMPKRNLLYHIWPVAGSMWQWNLDQLLQRIELFNGQRVMSIVHDERSVTPDEVQQKLAGHGFKFVIARNDEPGEAINYAAMLRLIASRDPNEIAFYGHAKGVKYEPDIPLPIRRWSEVQYQVVLDDWLTIREQLQRYAMTGPFKRYGRFEPHHNLADWHYSGTYFWVRHAHLFARDYQTVPQFYGGVETWPGTVFRKEETACVFIDDLGPSRAHHPYYPEFWRTAEPALKRWQSTVRAFPPPQDLVEPRPFKDDTQHLMEQKPEEFQWWLDLLLQENVTRLLIVGSKGAGFEWHLAREFFANGREIEITTIKSENDAGVAETLREAEEHFGQRITLLTTREPLAKLRDRLAPQYTAVFLDGDRSYKGSRADFEAALTFEPRLIALHDIVDSDWHAYARCCVSRSWRELREQYRTVEKSSDEWGGIGVVMI